MQNQKRRSSKPIIPSVVESAPASYPSNIYNIKFSESGDKMAVGLQSQEIYVYNSRDPYCEGEVYPTHHKSPFGLKEITRLMGFRGQWTMTDLQFFKEDFIGHCALSPHIELVHIETGNTNLYSYNVDTGFMSFSFVQDSIYAGCKPSYTGSNGKGKVVMWDMTRKTALESVEHGNYDTNAVVSVDNHLIASAGDNGFIKLWDTRLFSSNSKQKHVGFLAGHTQGITSLDSHAGSFLISNGKDQKLKMWDLRFASDASTKPKRRTKERLYDYRWDTYIYDPTESTNPDDTSILTCYSHSVYATMIKSYFSPCGNYIYSGSSDGNIYIWNMYGDSVAVICNEQDLDADSTSSETMLDMRQSYYNDPIIRDLAWHPNCPVIYGGVFAYAAKPDSKLLFCNAVV